MWLQLHAVRVAGRERLAELREGGPGQAASVKQKVLTDLLDWAVLHCRWDICGTS